MMILYTNGFQIMETKTNALHFVKDSISNDGLLQFKLESLIKAFSDTNCLHLIGIKENGRDDDLISEREREKEGET